MKVFNLALMTEEDTPDATLPEIIETMRQAGALVDVIGLGLRDERAMYTTVMELTHELGAFVERLGARALEMLPAPAAQQAPLWSPSTPLRNPRERRAKRRAA